MRPFDIATVLIEEVVGARGDHFDTEAEYARRVSAKRRREFLSGRCVARNALEQIGIARCEIRADQQRRPIWPDGVTGSISHCDALVGAAVALLNDVKAIGLDLENQHAVTRDLWDTILLPTELELLKAGRDDGLATVFFSCKEAVYKAANPVTDEFLNFLDVEILPTGSLFRASCATRKKSSKLISSGVGEYEIKDGVVRSIFVIC